jgi:uncharacterized protein (UPF0332 family)
VDVVVAYHEELMQQALLLVAKEPKKPKQASLLRAVSAAYYALFHRLIYEAVANWSRANLRAALGRAFDHGTMKSASNRLQNTKQFPFVGEDPRVVRDLRSVARTFAQLQERRHTADYDNSTVWTRTEALAEVKAAVRAFRLWRSIRNEQIAQAYLVSLIVRRRDGWGAWTRPRAWRPYLFAFAEFRS